VNSLEPARTDTAAPVPTTPVHTTPVHRDSFAALGVAPALLRALDEVGHTVPTPIQVSAIPAAIAGRDLLGCAQTGTGKTAAFALPILQRLQLPPAAAKPGPAAPRRIRALILSPTRELAAQIGDTFARYGKFTGLRHTVIYGGVGFGAQISALRRGVDVLVATPGRLADLINQREVNLDRVEVLVLDEADRMLDQGFLPEVRRLLRLIPRERQTLFFSATMPRELEPLADEILKKDPVRVAVAPVASTPDRVDQSVYLVAQEDKRGLLEHLMADASVTRAIVFTRTKHGADRVVKQLTAANLSAAAIHGNKSQNARERALGAFRGGKLRILVATDVAARGIDIGGVTHVLNYDMPVDAESYVHRIGRTARAGAGGAAISFCSPDERGRLTSVERLIKRRVAIVGDHPYARAGQRPSAPALPTTPPKARAPAPAPERARSSEPARPSAGARFSSRTRRG
jgi:ATP-dependent RNA helicase RhlE